MENSRFISVTANADSLLDAVRFISGKDRMNAVGITVNGKPEVVLMSMKKYESMCETMSVLGDSDVMRQIYQSGYELSQNLPLVDIEEL
ncbi:putative Predicted protein [Desulfamplus magnetovallimortis]|uniref:Antitoxin n=1 Tax=Desulfamplus magnetovallimortis TaxID=1246637 RepID=A0A1W1HD12_9BACT|nr:type II toxin-antitoxin system prevent-host-death family antitoxin [Desulfamplus magnetovallimortis]SLM30359.1 putative Predicted protein [Desulfamplus magnetovallimortis]